MQRGTHLEPLRDKQVAWLHVAVHDAAGVQEVKRLLSASHKRFYKELYDSQNHLLAHASWHLRAHLK